MPFKAIKMPQIPLKALRRIDLSQIKKDLSALKNQMSLLKQINLLENKSQIMAETLKKCTLISNPQICLKSKKTRFTNSKSQMKNNDQILQKKEREKNIKKNSNLH